MKSVSRYMLEAAQRSRLMEFSADACVEIHCHCLPGLDDGPATMQESLEMCRAMVADGITHVIATPHQLGTFIETNGREIVLNAVTELREQLSAARISLVVEPGGDVRIDEHLMPLLQREEVLTLADGRAYVLLEFPHETLVDPMMLIEQLAEYGICGIISHPERHAVIARKPEVVVPWIQAGALLQVTSASLLGEFGPNALTAAWRLIEANAVSMIASDAHDAHRRPPRMTQAIHAIAGRLGHAVARRLCIDNPCKVFTGEPIQSPRIARRFGGGA